MPPAELWDKRVGTGLTDAGLRFLFFIFNSVATYFRLSQQCLFLFFHKSHLDSQYWDLQASLLSDFSGACIFRLFLFPMGVPWTPLQQLSLMIAQTPTSDGRDLFQTSLLTEPNPTRQSRIQQMFLLSSSAGQWKTFYVFQLPWQFNIFPSWKMKIAVTFSSDEGAGHMVITWWLRHSSKWTQNNTCKLLV